MYYFLLWHVVRFSICVYLKRLFVEWTACLMFLFIFAKLVPFPMNTDRITEPNETKNCFRLHFPIPSFQHASNRMLLITKLCVEFKRKIWQLLRSDSNYRWMTNGNALFCWWFFFSCFLFFFRETLWNRKIKIRAASLDCVFASNFIHLP